MAQSVPVSLKAIAICIYVYGIGEGYRMHVGLGTPPPTLFQVGTFASCDHYQVCVSFQLNQDVLLKVH